MSIHNRIAAALPKTSRYESALRTAPLVGGAVGGLVVGELVLAPGGLVVGELVLAPGGLVVGELVLAPGGLVVGVGVGGIVVGVAVRATSDAEVTPIAARSPCWNCATKTCA